MRKNVAVLFLVLVFVASGAIVASTAKATSLTIDNPSFESPAEGSPGGYSTDVVTGWTVTGGPLAAGVLWPPVGSFNGPVPDGNQVLWLTAGSVSQTLSSVLTAGDTYTLDVDVGIRNGYTFSPSTVALLAGSTTLVAGGSSLDPGVGNFATLTLTYAAAAGNAYLGEPLTIEISNAGGQMSFDDVRLDASDSSVPVPPSVLLLAPGLLGLAGIRRRFGK